jgi:hypothetical protein
MKPPWKNSTTLRLPLVEGDEQKLPFGETFESKRLIRRVPLVNEEIKL